jgi:type II secretory pathway component PulF
MFHRVIGLTFFMLFWIVPAIILVAIIGGVLGITISPMLAVAGGIFVAVLPPFLELAGRSRRRRVALSIFSYLEQSIRISAPLPTFLAAAARSERGRLAARLRELRQFTENGVPLSQAIENSIPEINEREIGLIAVAELTGRLHSVLVRLVTDIQPPPANEDYDPGFVVSYSIMMVIVMTLAATILVAFVLPKYKDILHDFHLALPPLSAHVFTITTRAAPVMCVLLLVALILWLIRGIWTLLRGSASTSRERLNIYTQAGSMLPWFGASLRDRSLADVSRVLADGIEAGWPADAAMGQARQLALVPPVHAAVRQWADQVNAGSSLSEGARNARLPNLFVGILSAAGDEPAPALDFLARYYADRFSRLRILLRGALVPVAVLFFAGCVTAIALSMFLPLIAMINHVANLVGSVQ